MKTADEMGLSKPTRTVAFLAVLLAALAIGLTARLWLCGLAPRHGYTYDHLDNVQMGLAMRTHGLDMYAVEPDQLPIVAGQRWDAQSGTFVPLPRPGVRKVNYPPLGVSLFALSTMGLGDVKTLSVDPDSIRAGDWAERNTVVNTFTTRAIMAIPAMLMGLATAGGVWLLGRDMLGPGLGLVAAGVVWLAPPMMMDSCLWGQVDAWFTAPAVWAIWLMTRRRWLLAGVVLGAGVLLKPQGILMGPVALLAGLVIPAAAAQKLDVNLVVRRWLALAGGSLGALVLGSSPWLVTTGPQWVQVAILDNLQMYPYTTLSALNIWYLDALLLDGRSAEAAAWALNANAAVAGLTKDAWGKLLLAIAMIGLAWGAYRRFGRGPKTVVAFAGLWLWSTFMLPTRAHERYIILCVPLMILLGVLLSRRWLPVAVLALLAVASAELAVNKVLDGTRAGQLSQSLILTHEQVQSKEAGSILPPPSFEQFVRSYLPAIEQQWPQYRQDRAELAGREWALALTSIAAYLAAIALTLTGPSKHTRQATDARLPSSGKTKPQRKRAK